MVVYADQALERCGSAGKISMEKSRNGSVCLALARSLRVERRESKVVRVSLLNCLLVTY